MKSITRILVVDDESDFRDILKAILTRKGYFVECAKNGTEAVQMISKSDYDIVLTDLMMDKMGGMELLKYMKDNSIEAKSIVITAFGSVESAVEAMRMGAFSYFIKSNNPQELIFEIEKIIKLKELSEENEILKSQIPGLDVMLSTKSEKYRAVLELADKVATTDANVLIIGESGSGKEIITRYIHGHSQRSENIIVPVNCHALPENLLESELYGHEKGAFTGSSSMRKGRFEIADGGTLFLDEIGDIPLSTQVKILRSVENREIERIGSNRTIKVDFRLICATNKKLMEAIEHKTFREDLYYRISTVTIEVPPLRERKEDLPMLIDFFIQKSQKELKKNIRCFDKDLMDSLSAYDYPGNIRELKNIVERIIVMAEDEVVNLKDVNKYNIFPSNAVLDKGNYSGALTPGDYSLKSVRNAAEKVHIINVLQQKQFNIDKAALVLDISSRQLYNKVREYDIKIK